MTSPTTFPRDDFEAPPIAVRLNGRRARGKRPEGRDPSPAPADDGVTILGVRFTPLELDHAVERIRAMLRGGGAHHVVLANAHTMNCAAADPSYLGTLQRAALVLRDGVGVEVAGVLSGRAMLHNFVGTDFVPHLLQQLADPEVRVFLYGAEPGVAAAAAAALRARHSGIRVVGFQHGYENGDGSLAQIRAARPDVLLVALGNPRQERWIADHLAALGVPLAIGVGALFDYLAGRVPRAPLWMRRLRSEWIFRLVVEPRRLWRRYLVGNTQFLWHVVRAKASANGAGR
jgi:exopolysaccharide biosynthesis WecB/TagA/CpsF family protein